VYRNLEVLWRSGHIRKLDMPGPHRYDGNTSPHDHIRCKRCERVVDVCVDIQIPAVTEAVQSQTGFLVTGHHVALEGVCGECAKRG
jgi:Fur family ferric uptake transcriptional regulator